ncbi:MAG: DMT family transporter [Treponema sp.]|jgi:drug/metabolite transporter (DMT)-like permease|nr:DMT family transporter [Treponema sp.]
MNKRILRADVLLLLTAAIWGFGFVAQRSSMQYVGPFTFNGIRFILASLSLLPIIAWQAGKLASPIVFDKSLILSCLLAGTCLFVAVTLQQLGMMATTAGNAGFITGLYVIFTPIFGIFLGRKTGKATWVGAVLMLTGLYFLSFVSQSSSALQSSTTGSIRGINPGDIVIAVSAVFWALHVLIIDRLVKDINPLVISSGQFAVAGLYALAAAFLVEPFLSVWLETTGRHLFPAALFYWNSFPALISGLRSGIIPLSIVSGALITILYGGLASVGIGYTLQVVAQRDAPPAHATIILCLEGCFAVIGGILLLNEIISARTVIGFALALAGMLASQWELIRNRTGESRPAY